MLWKKVTWDRPAGFVAYSFRLYMRKKGNSEWIRLIEDRDIYKYTVQKGIDPKTVYEFVCQSYGLAGDGPFCEPVSVASSASRMLLHGEHPTAHPGV